uniref:Uncharacterized protein n=1 Tax=Panagrolaimus sp. JU765 TaxID=591449 RepID=A0AC34Q6U4_9BILA
MYAPAELHCAADSAGRAIHNALKAMNKLILLAPKDSVDRGFLKSIALMCAFLRQFYLELKSRRDRKSKLEVILRLWQQLQQQGSPSMPLATPPAEPVDGKNNAKEKVDKK